MENKKSNGKILIIVGICIWFPIWISAYIPFTQKLINESNASGLSVVVIMLIGIGLMAKGFWNTINDINKY